MGRSNLSITATNAESVGSFAARASRPVPNCIKPAAARHQLLLAFRCRQLGIRLGFGPGENYKMSRKRLKVADWIELGLKELSKSGPEALRLDAICEAAGVTKGSFYHHFENHGSFLTQTAELWNERQTDALIAKVKGKEKADDVAAALFDLALSLDYQVELGMRELARRNEGVADIVAQTDSLRLDFAAKIYKARFDLPDSEAADAAALEYAAFNGLVLISPGISRKRLRELAGGLSSMAGTFFRTPPSLR